MHAAYRCICVGERASHVTCLFVGLQWRQMKYTARIAEKHTHCIRELAGMNVWKSVTQGGE